MNITAFIGAKGGVGTTVTTALSALWYAKRHPDTPVLLVDCGNDLAAALGIASSDPPYQGQITPNVELTHIKRLTGSGESAMMLLRRLAAKQQVFVDCGAPIYQQDNQPWMSAAHTLWRDVADNRVLVLRNDYLSLRAAVTADTHTHAHVIACITERERSLRFADAARVVEPTVTVSIDHSSAIARIVDAGVMPTRISERLHGSVDLLLKTIAVLRYDFAYTFEETLT